MNERILGLRRLLVRDIENLKNAIENVEEDARLCLVEAIEKRAQRNVCLAALDEFNEAFGEEE